MCSTEYDDERNHMFSHNAYHCGALPARRAEERSPIPIAIEEKKKPRIEIIKFMCFFFHGQRGQRYSSRASPTTTAVEVSHQYGDLRHVSLR